MRSERMVRLSFAGSQTRSSPPFAQRSDSTRRDTVAPRPASHVSIRHPELRRATLRPQTRGLACARQRPIRKPAARQATALRPAVRAAVSPPQFFPVPLRPAPIEVPRDKQRLWIPILALSFRVYEGCAVPPRIAAVDFGNKYFFSATKPDRRNSFSFWYPPPPRSIGIIGVAGNSEVIPGHQSLAGKIFTTEDLRAGTLKIPGSPGFAIMDSFWVRRKVRCHSVTLWNLAFMLAHWFYRIVEMRSLQTQAPCRAKATVHRAVHLPQPQESRGTWARAYTLRQSDRRQ